MKPEYDDIERFLECTEIIDWQNPEIVDAARAVARPFDSDVDMTRRLFEWVRDRIPHSKDAGLEHVTCRASDVLQHGTGICYAKSGIHDRTS